MRKKYWIVATAMVAILVASLLAISNPNTSKEAGSKPTCCKKVVKECPPSQDKKAPVQTSLETLSTQFISVPIN